MVVLEPLSFLSQPSRMSGSRNNHPQRGYRQVSHIRKRRTPLNANVEFRRLCSRKRRITQTASKGSDCTTHDATYDILLNRNRELFANCELTANGELADGMTACCWSSSASFSSVFWNPIFAQLIEEGFRGSHSCRQRLIFALLRLVVPLWGMRGLKNRTPKTMTAGRKAVSSLPTLSALPKLSILRHCSSRICCRVSRFCRSLTKV